MKTAEAWVEQNGWLPWRGGDFQSIRAIQLDAVKHGMTLAAKMAQKNNLACVECSKWVTKDFAQEILAARDNLKELP